eukprot:1162102-Pelagomonas_calceolata.AAC.5
MYPASNDGHLGGEMVRDTYGKGRRASFCASRLHKLAYQCPSSHDSHSLDCCSNVYNRALGLSPRTLALWPSLGKTRFNMHAFSILHAHKLPPHVDEATVLGAISLNKDVDGFHPFNIGRLAMKVRWKTIARECTVHAHPCQSQSMFITVTAIHNRCVV